MPKNVTVTFADGSTHQYQGVPDDATPGQVEARAIQDSGGKVVKGLDGGAAASPPPVDHAARLQQLEQDLHKLEDEKPGVGRAAWEITKNFLKGAGDVALNVGAPMVTTPVAGIAGAVTSAASAPFVGRDRALELGTKVVENTTNLGGLIKPYSDVGTQAVENVALPFTKLAQVGDAAGSKVQDVTGSEALAAATNTAVQALPALLFRRRGAKAPAAAGETPKPGATVPPAAGTAGAAEGAPAGAPKTPGSAPSIAATVEPENVTRAKAYAADRLGLDWDAIAEPIRQKLATIAQNAQGLEGLDAAAITREAKFGSLPVPVPATRGALTRDPVALRNEGNAAATAAGQPIRDINQAANQALLDNLDVLKGKVTGVGREGAQTAEQTGGAVQAAARAKLELQKAKVSQLYKRADEAGETLQPVGDDRMLGIMDVVGDTVDQPHFSYVNSWLKANAKRIDEGQMTIRDLEKLRKQAVAKAMNGGEDGHYAGQLITAIDNATEGAGGKLYAEARAARRAQGSEFEQQGAVADLVDNSTRTDRSTALEKTTKTITSGSLEDVRKIKTTLLTGGDSATRTAGRAAWRDVRRQVVEDIRNEATKGAARMQDGSPNLTPAALKRAIDRYGEAKLDEIFGAGTRKQLYQIMDVAADSKTMPPLGGAPIGSSTVQNILAFLEKGTTKVVESVPLVGKAGAGIMRAGIEKVQDARASAQATTTPLSEAVKKADARTRARARGEAARDAARDVAPYTPLSQVGAQPQR
jgi:hypothetical protein